MNTVSRLKSCLLTLKPLRSIIIYEFSLFESKHKARRRRLFMVLLVVDAQNGIVDERLYALRKFVSNIKKLIGAAREQGIEVIYVQNDDGPGTGFSIGDDEFEVYSEFQPMPDEKRFIKSVCSAFKKESGLLEYLTREQAYHYYNEFLWPEQYADCIPMDRALELLKK